MNQREKNRMFTLVFFILVFNILLVAGVLANRAGIEDFQNRGKRFTYCDGILLYNLAVNTDVDEDLCIDNTEFTQFLIERDIIETR